MIDYDNWGEKPVPEIDAESEEYWTAANDGELLVQRCDDCTERQLYPRSVCRHCWSRELSFERAEGTGVVYSFAENYVPGHPTYDNETPYVVALVELDLPDENPSSRPVRLTSHVVDCSLEELEIGLLVTVTFRQISEDPERHLPGSNLDNRVRTRRQGTLPRIRSVRGTKRRVPTASVVGSRQRIADTEAKI